MSETVRRERCKEEVPDRTSTWPRFYRCHRYAVRDGYCKQHHPDSVAERRKKSEERYEQKVANSPWGKLKRVNDEWKRRAETAEQLAEANAKAAELWCAKERDMRLRAEAAEAEMKQLESICVGKHWGSEREMYEYINARKTIAKLRECVEWYADPETYMAIGFFPDPPCGEFINDFGNTEYGNKPGSRARAVLKELEEKER